MIEQVSQFVLPASLVFVVILVLCIFNDTRERLDASDGFNFAAFVCGLMVVGGFLTMMLSPEHSIIGFIVLALGLLGWILMSPSPTHAGWTIGNLFGDILCGLFFRR